MTARDIRYGMLLNRSKIREAYLAAAGDAEEYLAALWEADDAGRQCTRYYTDVEYAIESVMADIKQDDAERGGGLELDLAALDEEYARLGRALRDYEQRERGEAEVTP